MSLEKVCELLVRASLPKGAAWEPKTNGNYDKVISATGEIIKEICERAENARHVRDPQNTFLLDDLEREFGILKNEAFTEQQRRDNLSAKINMVPGNGTADDLQSALDAAGFDLQVHKNNPAVDPAIFLDQAFQMVAGGDNAYAGRPDAYAGRIGGELLVNGSVFEQVEAYLMQANGSTSYAGNSNAISGYFESIKRTPIEYTIPTDPDTWGFVFFIGGDATRNVSGELTDIEQAEVELVRKEELKRIILSIKPMYTWAGLIITYT